MSEAEEKKIAMEMERKLRNEEKAKEKEMKKQRALEKAKLGDVFKSSKPKTIAEKKIDKEEEEEFVDPETPLGEKR
ncbi:unnamed protein product [Arabidopsis lyrata]|uniref:Predicted protein n=1 Tax=Arabidopsis lyrata subsp. lyrata TaxID=81972 RepID=D7KPK1_ARALL|nr:predicted protein [Arabidopsis lyrata subsp. lyrata]CAH8253427.1 unnamed protein product [Arabidopsis lyrata]